MILMRETTPATIRFGTRATSWSTPSTRKRTRMSSSLGLEVDVGGALVDGLAEDRVDELDDRRVVGRLAQLGDVGELEPVLLLLLDRLR